MTATHTMKRFFPSRIIIVVALLSLASIKSQASSILLDFGPTAVVPADALRDPGHASGVVPGTEITWNRITGDTNTLYYSDGTAATGITLDLGRSTAVGPVGDDTINFSDNGFTVSALGTTVNTGVYAGTSPVRDGIFGGANGTNNLALGLRVDGLPAGTYRIVVHGRNSNTATQAGLLFYARSAASAGTYAFSMSDVTAVLSTTAPPIASGFAEGDNFGMLIVTIAAGQSLYIACEGPFPLEMRGFFNAITITSGAPTLPARITAHPANRTILETATATLIADGWGDPAINFRQWRFNGANVTDGPNISGANSNQLTLRNITTSMAGQYSLFVSNILGSDLSSNAVLTVTPVLNTEQMSNIWNLVPGERPYISTANTERGLAFNNVTTNLLLASRTPSNQVVVLNAQTGVEKHSLDVSGIVDGTIVLNHVGVAGDGAVFAANLTATAISPSYKIYRWANDDPAVPSTPVFIGDPGAGVQPNLRWGDNFTVRGTGSDTQILIAPGSGTNVALLRTTSGMDFQTEVPPTMIALSGVPANFGAITLGLAFGPGSNSFWAKAANGSLYLIQFDLNSNTGAVIRAYSTALVPGSVRGISTSADQKFLAGIALEAPNDNVRLYDVSDLVNGPLLRDQEAFVPQNANVNGTAASAIGGNYLFALDSNNGIKAFAINTNYVPPSVSIVTHPTDRTVMEGASATFTALGASSQPLTYRWRFNGTPLNDGPNVIGAATNTLVLKNVTTNSAGTYSLIVSNAFGTATSSNALLTIVPTFNTAQMSNIWNLEPGERSYLGTNTSTERGLIYNGVTTNLFLDVTGVPGTTPGVSLGLNTIGVSDDGVVYGAGVTVSATSPPFYVYRWPDDSAGNPPVIVFAGDPAASVEPNLGYGDVMAVRGAGADTQIILAPRAGTNVVILRTSSTMDFQTEVPPVVISVSNVPSAFAQLGLAFGPGTNTFWAKTINNALYLVQFDINTGVGTVIGAYSNAVPGNLRAISVDKNQKFLAGLALDTSVNVRLYDIADLVGGPILRDQEAFATANANVTVGGTGATTFGGNYVFALDSNNGIKAFLINTNYVPPLSPFTITSISHSSGSVVLTWPSAVGRIYQVQSRDSVSTGNWSNLNGVITATGSTSSFTNSTAGSDTRFYRVGGQ